MTIKAKKVRMINQKTWKKILKAVRKESRKVIRTWTVKMKFQKILKKLNKILIPNSKRDP